MLTLLEQEYHALGFTYVIHWPDATIDFTCRMCDQHLLISLRSPEGEIQQRVLAHRGRCYRNGAYPDG